MQIAIKEIYELFKDVSLCVQLEMDCGDSYQNDLLFSSVKTEANFTELVLIEIFIMHDCLTLSRNESGSG